MKENPQSNSVPPRSAGSLADLVGDTLPSPPSHGLPAQAWIKFGVLAMLFVGMNYWMLPILLGQWRYDSNWTHCFIIPLFSLYLLYTRRAEILLARRKSCYWALPLLLAAIGFQILSVYPIQTNCFYQIGMVVVIFSLVWLVAGTEILKLAWVPVLYLFLAIPIPATIYNRMAYPLQELAAKSSTIILQAFGVQITNAGSSLDIVSMAGRIFPVEIVEACSGVRSLMAFIALGVAMAYLEERPVWQRVIYVLSAIPIAILCNVLRVTITCQMFVMDKPEWGSNFMHEFTGILMLVPAFIMLWLVGKGLQSIFVEEDEDDDEVPASTPAQADVPATTSARQEMDK
jgi:exosortase